MGVKDERSIFETPPSQWPGLRLEKQSAEERMVTAYRWMMLTKHKQIVEARRGLSQEHALAAIVINCCIRMKGETK